MAFWKQPKGTKQKEKRARRAAVEREYNRVRLVVLERDGGICRICGGSFGIQVHHIQFRSAGRIDTTANLIAICANCNDAIHVTRAIVVTGDGDGALQVTRTREAV